MSDVVLSTPHRSRTVNLAAIACAVLIAAILVVWAVAGSTTSHSTSRPLTGGTPLICHVGSPC